MKKTGLVDRHGRPLPPAPKGEPVLEDVALCEAVDPNGFACTRPAGHRADHIAATMDGAVCAQWARDLGYDKPRAETRYSTLGTIYRAIFGDPAVAFVAVAMDPPETRPLADRVADDLARIPGLDALGPARPELPDRRDLSRYDDALAIAVRTCPHDVVEQPLYGKAELRCLGCDRYMDADVYQVERRERSARGRAR